MNVPQIMIGVGLAVLVAHRELPCPGTFRHRGARSGCGWRDDVWPGRLAGCRAAVGFLHHVQCACRRWGGTPSERWRRNSPRTRGGMPRRSWPMADWRLSWQQSTDLGVARSWLLGMAGALAAANADTWGTELGVLSLQRPRRIVGGQHVEPGTSGAVSSVGLLASVAGAALIGVLAWASAGTPVGSFGRRWGDWRGPCSTAFWVQLSRPSTGVRAVKRKPKDTQCIYAARRQSSTRLALA